MVVPAAGRQAGQAPLYVDPVDLLMADARTVTTDA